MYNEFVFNKPAESVLNKLYNISAFYVKLALTNLF